MILVGVLIAVYFSTLGFVVAGIGVVGLMLHLTR